MNGWIGVTITTKFVRRKLIRGVTTELLVVGFEDTILLPWAMNENLHLYVLTVRSDLLTRDFCTKMPY